MINLRSLPAAALSFVLCAFSQLSFAQENIEKSKQLSGLEKSLEEVMELYNCPGMAVTVVKKGEIIYAKGFGYADIENKRSVTAKTLFPIGSCTKAFTAVLIGQLENKGLLDLDESPGSYMPALSFYNDQMNDLITIRDMLSHRTGLPRHDWSWYLFPSNSRDSLVERIKYQQPTMAVREAFQYNNFMYMAAGALGEEITGSTWEENIYANILKPLDMQQSCLTISEMTKHKDRALGYNSGNDTKQKMDYHPIRGMAPAGAINSNAMEMGNWLLAWINGGKYNDKQVIPADFAREAISSQVVGYGGLPGKTHPDCFFSNYGFGWSLSSYRGHYRVEHGGNIDGFSSSVCFFPGDSLGISILVNQNYSPVPAKVRNIIADKILGLPDGKWYDPSEKNKTSDGDEKAVSAVSNRIAGTSHSHPLAQYKGNFSHAGYGRFRVTLKGDSLFAVFPEKEYWLRHKHYDVFEAFDLDKETDSSAGGMLTFNFHTNMNGEIDDIYLNAEQGLDPLLFRRMNEKLNLDVNELEKFVGKYDLGGAFAEIFINEENKLSLVVPGQPAYTLSALKENKFRVNELEGYDVEFEKGDQEEITAMVLIQPNGNFRVKRDK